MTLVDLVRTLAEPAPHDHRRLTPGQRRAEAIARTAATGLVLAIHATLRASAAVADTARTVRLVAHLWRDQ